MADEGSHLTEADILLAVAQAQGIMVDATVQIMKRDKHDGIRAAKWLETHCKLYNQIIEDYRMCCGGDPEVVRRADGLARENV